MDLTLNLLFYQNISELEAYLIIFQENHTGWTYGIIDVFKHPACFGNYYCTKPNSTLNIVQKVTQEVK